VPRTRAPGGPGESLGASAGPKLSVAYLPFRSPSAASRRLPGREAAHRRSRGPGRGPAREERPSAPLAGSDGNLSPAGAERRDRSERFPLRTSRPRASGSRAAARPASAGGELGLRGPAPAERTNARTYQHGPCPRPNVPTRGPASGARTYQHGARHQEPERTNDRTYQHGAQRQEPERTNTDRPSVAPRGRLERGADGREGTRRRGTRRTADRQVPGPLLGEFRPVHDTRRLSGPRSSSLPAGDRRRGRDAGGARVLRDVETVPRRGPTTAGRRRRGSRRRPRVSGPRGSGAFGSFRASCTPALRREARARAESGGPREVPFSASRGGVLRSARRSIGPIDAKRRARKRRCGREGKAPVAETVYSVRSEAARAKTQRQRARE